MEGTKLLIMEGTPPLRGEPYLTLINAVSMLKSKSTSLSRRTCLSRRKPKPKPHWFWLWFWL